MREKLDTNTIQLLAGSLFLMLMLSFFGNKALAAPAINCQTAYGEKSFTIENNSVAFHENKKSNEQGRKISSTNNAIGNKTLNGFRKTLYVNGNKHLIHIENTKKLSDADDYMAVTSPKGHKMTYPLTCELL